MWCIYILLLMFSNGGIALNILVVNSGPFRSHYEVFHPLLRELSTRGHSVTVINNFPSEKPIHNMRFIDLQLNNFSPPDGTIQKFASFPRLKNYMILWEVNPKVTELICENLLTNQNVKVLLAEGLKYDVVFVEQFLTSDCELAFASLFDAPLIGITSHVPLPNAYPRLGIPLDVASDPFYFSIGGPNPSLFYKIETALARVVFHAIIEWVVQPIVQECFERHMPHEKVDIERVARDKMVMMFVNQHYSLTGSRLSSPRVLEIGGIHLTKPKPVPEDIEKFLSTAEHGAIYVSFGSNLRASTMSPDYLQKFLGAFKSIPQKVLWKWEGDSFPEGHDNILPRKWFPQVDVLCHPKVLAFVSHGGMLSMSESAHCGKPFLAVPFFGDQFTNAASAKASGLGSYLYFQDITADSLSEAIKKLTSDEMQQSAQRVSKLWHDRPQPVLDSAIYWTEYVARHQGAPPALPSTRNAWFEHMLLDVYTVLIAIVLLLYWICYLIYKLIRLIICRLICRRFCKRKEKKQ